MADSYKEQEARIQDILTRYNPSEKVNIAQLARQINVPPARLRHRLRRGFSNSTRPPTNRALDDGQELILCEFLDRLDSIRCSARRSMVERQANPILEAAHTDPNMSPRKVGPDWVRRFLKRHPQYFEVTQRPQEVERLYACTKDDVLIWFRELRAIIQRTALLRTISGTLMNQASGLG